MPDYLRVRIRGALDLDVDWGNAEIECDGGPKRTWRIIARGFCVAPASTLSSDARILVSRFDFAGSAVFEDAD